MQVRPVAHAAVAAQSDHIPFFDVLPGFDQDLVQMTVIGFEAVVMVKDDQAAITALVMQTGILDDAVSRREYFGIHCRPQIRTAVELPSVQGRMGTVAEFTGNPFIRHGGTVRDIFQQCGTLCRCQFGDLHALGQ